MEIKICPNCKKPVDPSDYIKSAVTLVGVTDPRIKCKKCGYLGLVIILSDDGGKT